MCGSLCLGARLGGWMGACVRVIARKATRGRSVGGLEVPPKGAWRLSVSPLRCLHHPVSTPEYPTTRPARCKTACVRVRATLRQFRMVDGGMRRLPLHAEHTCDFDHVRCRCDTPSVLNSNHRGAVSLAFSQRHRGCQRTERQDDMQSRNAHRSRWL